MECSNKKELLTMSANKVFIALNPKRHRQPYTVWKDGKRGWRYTTPDGSKDSRLFKTQAEAIKAAPGPVAGPKSLADLFRVK
jgi:hypothetical protein